MPYFESSQEWLEQSILLLEARPCTTRITTRYSVKPPKRRASSAPDGVSEAPVAKPRRASLVIKTYDPASGVTLKYRTAKAAEVSRLVGSALGRLARAMAGVPLHGLDEPMPDAPPANDSAPAEAQGRTHSAADARATAPGGGKKKKKARR